jgi:hypothetical protein
VFDRLFDECDRVKGEVIQQDSTEFGQLYKVDWEIPDRASTILRTLWEFTPDIPNTN